MRWVVDDIATRTMVQVLVAQGRLREAHAMARQILSAGPDDPQLRMTLNEIGSNIRTGDPLFGLSPEGRVRARARLMGLLARVGARRSGGRPSHVLVPIMPLVPLAAAPVRQIDESGVALPVLGDDDCAHALVLSDETLSGIETPGVEYGHSIECAPAPADAAPPRSPEPAMAAPVATMPRAPASPHEMRGRKLRLLEGLTDRIARRKRGV